ncbi:MAG: leucine-rich repeat protein [bacterium]|uniref:Leucine-rich repeat protein n=1 Tax=Candidatus Aphodosoma intestinipullorum TaxID=2840674 RepID=A0A940DLC4_9BACT|nr:leucine-rich repeat protein [Candidatus Aphodosoma intestinipullorum]
MRTKIITIAIALLFSAGLQAEILSGYCGEGGDGTNVSYKFDTETGLLELQGYGATGNYIGTDYAPWYYESQYIKAVSIGEGITVLGTALFMNCSNMTDITIPGSVTEIGPWAFRGCTGLTGVTIPGSVTEIGSWAFYGCTGLTGVTIPESVTEIGLRAFEGCTGLTGITIPESVQTIGESAFENCVNVRTVTFLGGIPPSYKSFETSLFKSLDTVYLGGCKSDYTGRNLWTYADEVIELYAEVRVTARSSDEEMGTVSVGQPSMCGHYWEVTASEKEHYRFVRWVTESGEEVSKERVYSFSVTEYVTLIAEFAPMDYTIAAVANDEKMGTVSGAGVYTYLTEAELEATAKEHYRFVEWSDGETENPRLMTVTGDSALTAEFVPVDYTVTTDVNDEKMGAVSGAGEYAYLSEAVLVAEANEGYRFVEWSDGATENPRLLTVTGDSALTAEFALMDYTVTAVANDEKMGAVSGAGVYAYLTDVKLEATANEHYHFVEWNDGETKNPRTVTVEGDSAYIAEFAPNSYTISAKTNGDGMGSVTGTGTFVYLSEAILKAVANEHYRFVRWSDGLTDSQRTVTVTGDMTFTAEFEPVYVVKAEPENETMGRVIGSGEYSYKEKVTIEAVPKAGYRFVKWSDGATENPRRVTVTGDAAYTAEFAAEVYTITAEANDGTMGAVSGGGEYEYLSEAMLVAEANEGYRFVKWSDGETENQRRVIVTGDAVYTAEFAAEVYTVTAEANDGAMGAVSGGGEYEYLSEAVLVAEAHEGYRFVKWSDGVTENPRTVTVTGDMTFTAEFTSVTAIEGVEADEHLTVYSTDMTICAETDDGTSPMEVYDTSGRCIYRGDERCATVAQRGVYIVRVGRREAKTVVR